MKTNFMGKLVRRSEFLVFCALAGIWIVLSIFNPNYATTSNLCNIMKTMCPYGIIAVGLSFVIIQGDSDISTGASAGFSAVLGTALMVETGCMGMLGTQNEWIGMTLCILITMAFGALIGMGNAFMVVRLNMPPFIATVAMQFVLNGLKMVITSGSYVYPLPKTLLQFVKLGIPLGRSKIVVSFLILLGLLAVAHYILTYTTYGRSVYATGSNRAAAQLSGIRTNYVRFRNYMVLHALVALVGILNAGTLKQGNPQIGTDWHLVIMAACAIGGIKFSGGAGSMIGLLIGLFTLFSMMNAIVYLGANTFLQDVTTGIILMLIVVFDRVRTNRKIRA